MPTMARTTKCDNNLLYLCLYVYVHTPKSHKQGKQNVLALNLIK